MRHPAASRTTALRNPIRNETTMQDQNVEAAMTAEKKFSFGFNLIWVVQSLLQKYFGSLLTQITSTSLAIPAHTEGRFAIVTDVGQGCDGRGLRC